MPPTEVTSNGRDWLIAAVLSLPVLSLYAFHFLNAPAGLGPTGFIQYDQPYYMANAREVLDAGNGLTYGNPFSADYQTAQIYFQPLALLLATVLRLTGADPGAIYVGFGLIALLGCLRVMIALYRALFPLNDLADHLGLLIFTWGGGLLFLAGLARKLLAGSLDLFFYDPDQGWWFLNLGRNLIFPTEAFYHLLFLGTILLIVRQRWWAALAAAAILCASHPFTGIELLGIALGWSLLERFVLGNRTIPALFYCALAAMLAVHAGYYLVYLNRDPEHLSLFAQWRTLTAVLPFVSAMLAYGPVALLALWSVRRTDLARAVFDVPHNRLLAVWFAGAFALANNDLLIEPIQPLHFTRGYVWTPLFLLAAPLIVTILRRAIQPRSPSGLAVATAICGFFLLDNFAWITLNSRAPLGNYASADQRALFRWLSAEPNRGTLVLANPELAYAATVYSPVRGWITHDYNTPFAPQRREELAAYRASGRLPLVSAKNAVLVVRDSALADPLPRPADDRPSRLAYRHGSITVWRVEPE